MLLPDERHDRSRGPIWLGGEAPCKACRDGGNSYRARGSGYQANNKQANSRSLPGLGSAYRTPPPLSTECKGQPASSTHTPESAETIIAACDRNRQCHAQLDATLPPPLRLSLVKPGSFPSSAYLWSVRDKIHDIICGNPAVALGDARVRCHLHCWWLTQPPDVAHERCRFLHWASGCAWPSAMEAGRGL